MGSKFCSFFILALLMFISCTGGFMGDFNDIINDVTQKTGRNIEKDYPFLEFMGTGGSLSSNNDFVRFKMLAFNIDKKLEKNDAVKLISEIVSIYLENIYSEKKIEAYLKEHPFTYENIHISLYIHTEKQESLYHPDIGIIALRRGKISYMTMSLTEKGFPREETYIEEPYEEALKRVGK
jgi:hypothetical protein